MTDSGVTARAEAIRILTRWVLSGVFPDRQLASMATPRHGFVMELVYASVRWLRWLDVALRPRLRRPPPPDVEAALRIGACQVLRMPGIPPYAAVDATVEALRTLGASRPLLGLVNGVLRALVREEGAVLAAMEREPLAVRLSHPDVVVERWVRRWGEARATAVCEWNNRPAHVTLLVLQGGPSVMELLERFNAAGVDAAPHAGFPREALTLAHGTRVSGLPGFAEGDFAVQDPSTLDAVRLLDVQPGQRVLDACAAPGGKAAQIARRLGGRGRLVALDRNAGRLASLRETLERIVRGTPYQVMEGDAAVLTLDAVGGPFDRILLDVPCGNSGVFGRRPDARWRAFEGAGRLARLQAAVLRNAAKWLAPGGRMVYSTCSIEPGENEQRIASFLQDHEPFRLCGEVLRLPGEASTDGAYAAALTNGSANRMRGEAPAEPPCASVRKNREELT